MVSDYTDLKRIFSRNRNNVLMRKISIKTLLTNKVLIYLSSRYITYALQFITSLVIAAKLGPYYFGIWGFFLLLLSYFQQVHFGISNSFSVLYVQSKDNEQEKNYIISNSVILISYLSVLVICVYLYYRIWGIPILNKYEIDPYFFWVCLIAILQYFHGFIVNVFRVKNKIGLVTYCQSVVVILNFLCIFFFNGSTLLIVLAMGYLVGYLSALIVFLLDKDIPRGLFHYWSSEHQKKIIKKGLLLFLYNTCFYFIILSVRTIVSSYYTVEEFGYFTFSFALAHAIMLLLESLTFLVFPKLVSKLSSPNLNEANETITRYRQAYITSSHLLVYFAMILFPFIVYFFPKYAGAITAMNIIALTILTNAHSCGYSETLISRNKEKYSAVISLVALIVNCAIAIFLAAILKVPYSFVILSTLITYLLFSSAVCYYGRKFLGQTFGLKSFLKAYFSGRQFLPYVIALIVSILDYNILVFLPLLVFVILNWKEIKSIINVIKRLFTSPEMVNL